MVSEIMQEQSDQLDTNLPTALQYAELGWKIFPCWQIVDGACACGNKDCKSPGKHPISTLAPRGQDSATSDKDIITAWWQTQPKANIAIYLAGSGLCAIDIDPRNGGGYTIEDLEDIHGPIEPDILQYTGGGGEHRVFLRPDGNLPGKLGPGVDVKLNGYIIAEPSNHISGGNYIWDSDDNPFDGAVAGPLPDWIRSFSTATQYQDNNSGQAINTGMTDDQYYDVLEALPFIDNNDRDTWLKVGMALHTANDKRAYEIWCNWSATSEKYDQNDQYRVWRSFRHKGLSSVDLPTLFQMAQDAGWVNCKKAINNTFTGELIVEDDFIASESTQEPVIDVPTNLLTTPVPMLNAIAAWMESYSREPQPQITMQGTLALASVLCGRIYESTQSNTSSLYMMVLGETGVGKNYVINAINDFLAESELSNLLSGSGNTSSGAVYSALFDSPCHIQIIDEIGKQLQTARKQVNGQMAEAFSTLVEAYSRTTGLMMAKNYSSMGMTKEQRKARDKSIVHYPAITILGLATPRQVYNNLSTDDIEDGFLNRLVVVDVTTPQAELRRSNKQKLPEFIKDWAKSIRSCEPESRTDLTGFDTDYDMRPTPRLVEFTDEADELFYNNELGLRQRIKDGEFVLPEMTKRWNENAMRMATMLAVCADPKNPVITLELAQWSIDYVEYYGNKFMLNVSTKVADSDFHRLYLAVQEFVEKAGSRGMTEYDLSRNCRLYAATSPSQRDQVLGALYREGRISQFSFKPKSGRGRPRNAWVAKEFITEEMMALSVENQ